MEFEKTYLDDTFKEVECKCSDAYNISYKFNREEKKPEIYSY